MSTSITASAELDNDDSDDDDNDENADVEGAIAEDAPPRSPADHWRYSYDRSSFLFQSSYLPDDFAAGSSVEDETARPDADSAVENSSSRTPQDTANLVARRGSNSSSAGKLTPINIDHYPYLRDSKSGSSDDKQNRLVSFRDELSVHVEETASNFGDDSTWRGFKIIVPAHPHNLAEQDCIYSRTGLSTMTHESPFLSMFLPKTVKTQWVCILLILLLITGSVTVAITCGKGYCGNQNNSSANDAASTYPSQPPAVQPQTNLPTLSPTLAPRLAFATLEELYAAVDAYVAEDYQSVVKEIAIPYGHPIGTWRVELLTNFTSVFDAKRNPVLARWNFHDSSLRDWDTSRATTMRYMFRGAQLFNDDLSQWDTSQVVDMRGMFHDCTQFEGTGLAQWETGNVRDFREFLRRATSFRGDLGPWDVSSAINMHGMFRWVRKFNSDLSKWQTGKVTNMSKMFMNCYAFEGNGLEGWDTSSVRDMSFMFAGASSFNGNLSLWNVTSVQSMEMMYGGATSFTGDLSQWNTENVVSVASMFRYASSFNSDIERWITRNVQNFSAAFFGASSFRSDISSWDVSSAADMSMAFVGASNFDIDLCRWRQQLSSSGPVLTRSMFIGSGCPNTDDPDPANIEQGPYCVPCVETSVLLLSDSDTYASGSKAFDNIYDLYDAVDQYLEDNSPTSDIAELYGHPIRAWNVSELTSFESVFDVKRNPSAAYFNESLSGWDTGRATIMRRMFAGAYMFNNVLAFNTSAVTDVSGMFESADRFNQDLSSFDMRSVVNMTSMFKSALSFEGKGLEKWQVNNVVHMNALFEEAISFSGTVGSWRTENAVDMSRLFHHATSFTDDLSSWMVERVRIFDYAFNGARLWNRDISRWKIGSAFSFVTMFVGATTFNQDLCTWGPQLESSSESVDINTLAMFVSTACPITSDPDPRNPVIGPFCRSCTAL